MHRTLTLLVAAAFAVGLTAAPTPKEKDKAKDEDAIQGTWKIESFDLGGAQGGPPPGEVEKIRMTFKKDGKLAMSRGQGDDREGEYKLDASAKPKAIDLIAEGRTSLGIYELDGDTLKLCIAEGQNATRPEEMKPDGNRQAVVTLKRVKEEKKDK